MTCTRGSAHLNGASNKGFCGIWREKGPTLFDTPTISDPLVYREKSKVVLWKGSNTRHAGFMRSDERPRRRLV